MVTPPRRQPRADRVGCPGCRRRHPDWTGFYAGAQYGKGSFELSGNGVSADEDMDAYGLHGGYLRDFGKFVLGGELDYNKLDIDNVDDKGDLTRLRARAGYDMGRFMPYVTLGVGQAVSRWTAKATTFGNRRDLRHRR